MMEALFLWLIYVTPIMAYFALAAWLASKLDDRP